MSGPTPFSLASAESLRADLLFVGCFEGEPPQTEGLPDEVAAAVQRLAGRPGFTGREGQSAETALAGGGIGAVMLRGFGEREELDAVRLRACLEKACEAARTNGYGRLGVALPSHRETTAEAAAERIQRQLMIAGYRYDRFLGTHPKREGRLEHIELLPPPGEESAYRGTLATAEAVARAVVEARDPANTPANEASPEWMEEQARALGRRWEMEVEVLDVAELERRGMGGLLAVGAGSRHPPRLVRLEWGERGPVVALVGKGITFDTGGISIKPAGHMDEMKYDKCGACTVLGVAAAVAALELPLVIRAYVPLAENMPDGSSYRPGDIISCYNGKTVEVINTDAEGRLILADALAWAAEDGAETLLEFSTLTGACVIALGRQAAGLYSPDDELATALLESAGRTGERLWRMPLWPELVEEMRGRHADLKNSSDRWGSANTAAAFLSQFVAPVEHWAHLDIAGPANTTKNGPGATGATGYGIAFTVDWLHRFAAR